MPGLRLIESNQLEVLSEALAVSLSEPLSSPLTPEIIVVQSRGMQRWLSLELARLHSVCANVSFPFPNAFVLDMFSRVLPGLQQDPLFEQDALCWRIMDCLPGLLDQEEFAQVRHYLVGDMNGMKLFQLSSALAHIFDQYVVFRPEMVLAWEEGSHSHDSPQTRWQSALWRAVVNGERHNHRARLRTGFFEAMREGNGKNLPERVSVFGVSYLPPFHLEVFRALGDVSDVGIYVLNPCREYWADIKSRSRITRISRKVKGASVEELHLDAGNELLAGHGYLGRDFLDMLLELEPEETDLFVGNSRDCSGGDTMLGRIQNDILFLRSPVTGEPSTVGEGDRSVQVHSCHSPMREVEVLKDTMLSFFEEIPWLTPRDVLVMAPDIEEYAPLIHAVFGDAKDDSRRMPYSISDRTYRRSSKPADALLAVLDLASGRFEASAVMDLLDREPVRMSFNITEEGMATISQWVAASNIRWGFDKEDRLSLNLPGFEENTFDFGMRRLLLGYAMAGEEKGVFEGIAPFSDMDPAFAGLLGSFAEFVHRLHAWVGELKQDRDLSKWSDLLLMLIEDMLSVPDEEVSSLMSLKAAVRNLARIAKDSGSTKQISIDVVRLHFKGLFSRPAEGSGFLERGITFCSMLPMRSIPFRVICLMGMSHEAFPRRDVASGLDLMTAHRMKGDRSRRADDLYLFLEALLSAREVLCISYVGMGIQDNAVKPPSVVVSSLLEYLDRAFTGPNGGPVTDRIVTHHCLQAFNAKYFLRGWRLFSYSMENASAARALRMQERSISGQERLGEPGEEWRTLDAERLMEFLRSPAGFFLKNRLMVRLPREEAALQDREPFTLSGLDSYDVRRRLLAARLAGRDREAVLALLRAEGVLPHGLQGEMVFREMDSEIETFHTLIKALVGEAGRIKQDISLALDGFTITGSIDTLPGSGYFSFRHADITPVDRLRAWISHLLLQANSPGQAVMSRHIGKKRQTEFAPVEDPKAVFGRILDVYWQGLSRPLHFFPRSSYAFARAVRKSGKPEANALKDAEKVWTGSSGFTMAEGDDAAHLICFADADPLDREFMDLSLTVFGPLMDHMTEENL